MDSLCCCFVYFLLRKPRSKQKLLVAVSKTRKYKLNRRDLIRHRFETRHFACAYCFGKLPGAGALSNNSTVDSHTTCKTIVYYKTQIKLSEYVCHEKSIDSNCRIYIRASSSIFLISVDQCRRGYFSSMNHHITCEEGK